MAARFQRFSAMGVASKVWRKSQFVPLAAQPIVLIYRSVSLTKSPSFFIPLHIAAPVAIHVIPAKTNRK